MSKNLSNLPSDDQKAALAGNVGTPSSTNKYATQSGNITGLKTGETEYSKKRIKFAQSGGATITVTEDGDDLLVTISAGTSFPGFYGSAPPADSGAGSAGATGTASRGDHYHPRATTYDVRVSIFKFSSATNMASGALSYTPRIAFLIGDWDSGGDASGVGAAVGTGASNQQCMHTSGSDWGTGANFFGISTSTYWSCTVFSKASGVTSTRQAGTGVFTGAMFIIGDNAA